MGDKWNYEPRLDDPEGVVTPEMLKRLMRQEHYGISELEKTQEELRMIEDLNTVFGYQIKDMGLKEIAVPEQIVHVVTPEEFRRKVTERDTARAAWRLGHIYVQRNPDRADLILDLSHEMSHDVAYLKKLIIGRKMPDGTPTAEAETEQHGLETRGQGRKMFAGMNEGVTELFARGARWEYARETRMSGDERDRLLAKTSYPGQTTIMRIVAKVVAGKGNAWDGVKRMELGHITGDMSFLEEIEAWRPGAAKVLEQMGTGLEDAERAAKALDVEDEFKEEMSHYSPA